MNAGVDGSVRPDMDLIVWYDDGGSIAGFELYYDKNIREHVFIWSADRGFTHLAVDDGEQKPVLNYKEAPILIPDGHIDPNRIRTLFEGSCRKSTRRGSHPGPAETNAASGLCATGLIDNTFSPAGCC